MKRFLKWLGIAVLALALLLISLIVGWMEWGRKDWQQAQSELQAKGEKLTFAELVPPAPPDNENFFADPIWQQLSDLVLKNGKGGTVWSPRLPENQRLINQWVTPLTEAEKEEIKNLLPYHSDSDLRDRRTAFRSLNRELAASKDPQRRKLIAQTMLELMQPAASVFDKIGELSKRSGAYFPIRYQDNFSAPLPHVPELLKLGQLFSAKSIAELELGEITQAKNDVLVILDLSKTLKDQPILISFLIRISLINMSMRPIGNGIEHHLWSNGDLLDIQQNLASIHSMNGLPYALRGERACFFTLLESLRKSNKQSVSNISLPEQITSFSSIMQPTLEILDDSEQKALNINTPLFPGLAALKSSRIQSALKFLVVMTMPAIDGSVQKTVEWQTQVLQTLIACAVERYRLAHGSYPPSLDLLVPEYLTAIPKEPTTGDPMHYRLIDAEHFLLWAPGWNLKSLGGKTGEFKGDGDIVWNQKLPTQDKTAASRP